MVTRSRSQSGSRATSFPEHNVGAQAAAGDEYLVVADGAHTDGNESYGFGEPTGPAASTF